MNLPGIILKGNNEIGRKTGKEVSRRSLLALGAAAAASTAMPFAPRAEDAPVKAAPAPLPKFQVTPDRIIGARAGLRPFRPSGFVVKSLGHRRYGGEARARNATSKGRDHRLRRYRSHHGSPAAGSRLHRRGLRHGAAALHHLRCRGRCIWGNEPRRRSPSNRGNRQTHRRSHAFLLPVFPGPAGRPLRREADGHIFSRSAADRHPLGFRHHPRSISVRGIRARRAPLSQFLRRPNQDSDCRDR